MSNELEKLLLKPAEVIKVLSIGRSTVYGMIASGELPCVRIGRAVRVPVSALQIWIAKQLEQSTD